MSTYDGRKPEPPYPADLDQVIADIAAELGCKADNEEILTTIARLLAHVECQAELINTLIERLSDAGLVDDMDRVEFNKWSQAHQQIIAFKCLYGGRRSG